MILHVHGSGFTATSVITFNGGDEVTAFVSDTELTTGVKPSLAQAEVDVPVTVKNGAVESEPATFSFCRGRRASVDAQAEALMAVAVITVVVVVFR